MAKPETKLTQEEFTLRAILALRVGKYKGIHTVYSGFNNAFREYFNNEDPVPATKALADAGKIALRIAKGGAIIYRPEDGPKEKPIDNPLSKILGAGDAKKK